MKVLIIATFLLLLGVVFMMMDYFFGYKGSNKMDVEERENPFLHLAPSLYGEKLLKDYSQEIANNGTEEYEEKAWEEHDAYWNEIKEKRGGQLTREDIRKRAMQLRNVIMDIEDAKYFIKVIGEHVKGE